MEETGIGDEEFQEFRNKEVKWVANVKGVFEERKSKLWVSNDLSLVGTRVCLFICLLTKE